MGTVYDENNPVEPEGEVKKLQDLVKQLEQQNQILKSKQHNDNETDTKALNSNGSMISGFKDNGTVPKYTRIDNSKTNIKYKNNFDDVDILDIEEKTRDEEDTWLFTSPKASSATKLSPYKWVRQDLERPSPEVENTRKSLVFRLDDATKMARYPSSGTVVGSVGLSNPQRSSVSQSPRNNNDELPRQRRNLSSLENRVYDSHITDSVEDGSRINTNTFRLKKKTYNTTPTRQSHAEISRDSSSLSPRSFDSPHENPEQQRPDVAERLRDVQNIDSGRDQNGNGSVSRQSSTDTNSIESPRDGEYNKLTDVVDVQVLARMQEDSLRKSMTSPAQFTNKRALSKTNIMSSSNGYGSDRSSPARYQEHEASAQQNHTPLSNRSVGSLSSHSDSPSASPYSSHQHLEPGQQAYDAHRRSMPNLAKSIPMSLSSHPSDPELNDESPVNTNTFTRRKSGLEKSPLSRYGSGGLVARSAAQGLPTYQRTQSPAARGDAPQRTYQARNVSPGGAPRARNVSHVKRQVRNVSPVNTFQARNVSPVRNNAPQDSNASPMRNTQARNVPPGRSRLSPPNNSYASEQGTDWSGTYTRTRSPHTTGNASNYSANSLHTPPNPSRTLSPQRARSAGNQSMSPARSGLPAPKSTGIPRPGSNSRLPAPRKSAIPSSRRAALFNRSTDDSSWKDGCY